jgi:tetratricopeptide (TPR) repeat protein
LAKDSGGSNETADNIRISLARVYRDSGNVRRLNELCREVLETSGDRAAEASAMMAEAADKAGDGTAALSLFERAFRAARDEGLRVWSGLELARLMYRDGKREDAVKLVSEIINDTKNEDNRRRAERMLDGFGGRNQ